FRGWFDGIEIERGIYRGLYSIAICSDRALPAFSLGMFENFRESADTWNLLDACDTPAQLLARLNELTHLQHEFEEKAKHVALLQRDLEEKSQQVTHFQRESEQQSQLLARLKDQLEISGDRLARTKDEL